MCINIVDIEIARIILSKILDARFWKQIQEKKGYDADVIKGMIIKNRIINGWNKNSLTPTKGLMIDFDIGPVLYRAIDRINSPYRYV